MVVVVFYLGMAKILHSKFYNKFEINYYDPNHIKILHNNHKYLGVVILPSCPLSLTGNCHLQQICFKNNNIKLKKKFFLEVINYISY